MRRSFTVVELLMAVALTLVIGLLVNMAFTNTQMASRRATSALDYRLKGRAIMDLISTDISNMITTTTQTNSYPTQKIKSTDASTSTSYISFKTLRPTQNSHYASILNLGLTGTAYTKQGYYPITAVRVGWYYKETPPDRFLYRRVSPPDEIRALSPQNTNSVLAARRFQEDTAPAPLPDHIEDGDLVTKNDLRDFVVRTIPPDAFTAGEIVTGYEVSFIITNAPLTVTNKTAAEEGGYVWVSFQRTIACTPYVVP